MTEEIGKTVQNEEQADRAPVNEAVESAAAPAKRKSSVHSWMRDLIVSVAVSTFIIIFLYQPVRVEGTSMLPMLEDQDRLFINKLAYRVGEIQRGDVVVFGSESNGLPPSLLEANRERSLRIPIRPQVRSLNLSNSVAIALYEALRQWD